MNKKTIDGEHFYPIRMIESYHFIKEIGMEYGLG